MGAESESVKNQATSGAVSIYCLAALVVEEAHAKGWAAFAGAVEHALTKLLEQMPRDQQSQALRLAYEMALAGQSPAAPRLRLVYSRD